MAKKSEKPRNEEIFEVISRMFAEKGYLETTMRDIAAELDIKPPSLYNYFRSKEEALFILLNDSVDSALRRIREITSMDIPAKDKLSKFIELYTYSYGTKMPGPILLLYYVDKLTKKHQRVLINKQRKYADEVNSILLELREDGLMKEIPSKIALYAFFGMVNYTIKWYRQSGDVRPKELADYFLEIYTKGILK